MCDKLNEAIELFKNYKLDEALKILEVLQSSHPEKVGVHVTLGKLYTRKQNYGEALNHFQHALNIDNTNNEAITGLQLIRNILQLTNNYYYENPYTDDNLYEFD